MTPARAAEVLREGLSWSNADVFAEALQIGADALEFQTWLFGDTPDGWLRLGRLYMDSKWGGFSPFLDYARAEWEKERKG